MKSTLSVPVEFGDTDPAAIVFYPNYFRWFDAAAWRLLIAAGLTLDILRSDYDLIGVPIVDAGAKFRRPVRFGDTVEVTSQVIEWSGKTFRVSHEVRNKGDLCAEGYELRVCARAGGGESGEIEAIEIPDEIRSRLSAEE